MISKLPSLYQLAWFVGIIHLAEASTSIIQMENNAQNIRLQIKNEREAVQDTITLKKEGNQLSPTAGEIYTAITIDGANAQKIKLSYQDLLLEILPNGGLLLSGRHQESLVLSYNGNAKVEKGKELRVENDCLLQGFNQFENEGTMHLSHDLTTIITSFSNNGEFNVGRAWQDTALKRFENGASGKISLQRADFMSPSVSFTNKGTIACVSDWDGAGCATNNFEGAQFNVGGDCTLMHLSNFSQMEPQLKGNGAFEQVSTVYKDGSGGVVTNPGVLTAGSAEAGDGCDYHGLQGYKREITYAQSFTRREGARSQMYVGGMLVLMAGNSSNRCSDLLIGQDLVVKAGVFQNIGWKLEKNVQCAVWKITESQRRHKAFHRPHWRHWYKFVHEPTQSLSDGEIIAANTYVMGKARGNIQSITNGKVDPSRLAIAKTTSTALQAKQTALEAFVRQHGVHPAIDGDLAEYKERLESLRANPTLAYWTEQQQKRACPHSAPASAAPSRAVSPVLGK